MITHTFHDSVLEVTMDTGKGNLLATCDLKQLCELIDKTAADDSTDGIIITGTGHAFSTGLDLANESTLSATNLRYQAFEALDNLLVRLFHLPKPFVAAVNGHSIGAGFLIQLCADWVIATDNPRIKFGLPELSLGLTIDRVMTHLARHGFPNERLLQRTLYSGEFFAPEMAVRLGVVDEVVTADSMMNAARAKTAHLLRGTLNAFSLTKKTLRHETARNMEEALVANSHAIFDDLMHQKINF